LAAFKIENYPALIYRSIAVDCRETSKKFSTTHTVIFLLLVTSNPFKSGSHEVWILCFLITRDFWDSWCSCWKNKPYVGWGNNQD